MIVAQPPADLAPILPLRMETMHIKSLINLAAATISLAGPVSAIAQAESKQTVASAQAFLNMILPGKEYRSAYVVDKVRETEKLSDMTLTIKGRPKLVNVSPIAPCVSNWTYQYPANTRVSIAIRLRGREDHPLSAVPALDGLLGDPQGVHWSTLQNVSASGTFVLLKFASNTSRSEIDLGDASLASRVGKALEFLRVHCDATGGTGF